jgi:hypothetical protein
LIINEKRKEFYLYPIDEPLNKIKKSEFDKKYRLNKTNEQDALRIREKIKEKEEIEKKQKTVSESDFPNELVVQIFSRNKRAIPFTFIIKKSNP